MRKIVTIIIAAVLTLNVFAQAPQKMSYQAVIRNSSSALVTSTTVGMRISILQGSSTGTSVYVETHTPTSNANGLVSIEIGAGSIVSGNFSAIDWSAGPYFIKTETDPSGGITYTIFGTSELLSVPYSLHSKTAESITGGITETDPIFNVSPANGISNSDITNWNNKLDIEVDGSITNEIQILSLSNDTIYLSNGGFVKLPIGFDGQYSSLTGTPTNISTFTNDAGYLTSFTEVDGSVTNEIQALSLSNDTIYLSNGGFVKIPSSNAWSLNGNAGTVNGTNFIGTTDNVPLNFRMNNEPAGKIDFSSQNTSLGYHALFANTTGLHNSAFGLNSSASNTDGSYNTTIGIYSNRNNTTGNFNTIVGAQAGENNVTGSRNVFIGYAAGYNETGSNKLYIANDNSNPPLIYGDFANGKVGIGNNNPSARLHIGNGTRFAASSDASIFLQSGNGAGSARDWKMYVPMTGGYLAFKDMGFDNLNNGMATDAMVIQSGTGNIGMGTSSPNARLDLGLGYGASGEKLIIYNDNTSGPLAGTKTGFYLDRFSLQNNTTFVFPTAPAFPGSYIIARKKTNSTLLEPLMTVLGESGNVGIGTTNPTSKLEVQGAVKIVDGTEGVNKVLTSDANGLATWEAKESKAYGMIYRSIAFDIPIVNAWTDLPLNGGNNDLINVTHSTSTNAERVTVNVSGTYLIQYIIHYRRHTASHHGVSRLIKNGSVEIPGSYTIASPVSNDGNEEAPLSTQVITTLSANDYFNIQVATSVNVTNEVDSYSNPALLPAPTTPISVSITIVKIGE